MKIRLLLIVFSPLALCAQYLPDLNIPKLRSTEYENLQTKTVAQIPGDFQLKGPVKEVCETICMLKENGEDSSLCLRAEYLFSEKGRLLNYSEDSTGFGLMRYNYANRIVNSYDSTGEMLLETIRWINYYQKSKTVIRFNEQGFKTQEIYTCYDCESSMDRNDPFYDSIFDYTLNYQWTPDFDSVRLEYRYLKARSPYQRQNDITRSFVRELDKKRNTHPPTSFTDFENLYFNSFQEDIKTDGRNRIIEWTIWDRSIKSSMNVHRKTEYCYNDNDELTEIKHYSSAWSDSEFNFQLELREEITYISYDANRNWTELEVRVQPQKRGHIYPSKEINIRYKRNISYY